MSWTTLLPLAIPAAIVALSAVALVAGSLSAQSEAKQSSQVGRIEGTVGRVAGDIASRLLAAQAAGGSADVLATMQQAAISAGADYVQRVMPSTVAAAGATAESLVAMIAGELGRQLVASPAPVPPALMAPAAPEPLAEWVPPAPAIPEATAAPAAG